MTYEALCDAAIARHLRVLGAFYPNADDKLPVGTQTLVLLGPDEPGFWPAFRTSNEWHDSEPHPVDRWSARVIGGWAEEIRAVALFPFGGEPYHPFFTWATRTGRIHASPIMLLVHDQAGLFVSFRGALALADRLEIPTPPPKPCDTCIEKPCLTSCPVNALRPGEYDVPRCKSHIQSADSGNCMGRGCAARRACPVSKRSGRLDEQSAYHMQSFVGR